MNAEADRLDLAAEYVLGTLDAAERDEAEARIQSDAAFAALVNDWERRLGELSAMVEPVSPPPELWMAIQGRLADLSPSAAVRLPEFLERPVASSGSTAEAEQSVSVGETAEPGPVAPEPEPPEAALSRPAASEVPDVAAAVADPGPAAPEPEPAEPSVGKPAAGEVPDVAAAEAEPRPAEAKPQPPEPLASVRAPAKVPDVTAAGPGEAWIERADQTNIVDLTRRLRRWRSGAAALGALAAALAAIVFTAALAPGHLPEPLRPKPEVRTVEVPREVIRTVEVPAPAPGRFVAVLQSSATAPAFILTVDVAQRSLTVRRVSAETHADHSYELWLVSDRLQQPRSLGLIGRGEFTRAPKLANFDPDTISEATFAVSLEPEGGSPTGTPTGPVLFSGKLVETVPPTTPTRTP